MFSRYRCAPAAAVMLVCFSVLILSAVLVYEPSHAKTPVIPVVTPGDPDEFETRVSEHGVGGGARTPLSGDESLGNAGSTPLEAPREDVKPPGEVMAFRDSALSRALKRFVTFVVIELDVM